jgi:probable HAF family extracellular repeat protein
MAPVGFGAPPPGLSYGYAWDINAAGQVVGEGFNNDGAYHAFIYRDGETEDLGVLDGFENSMALGINAKGEIVGRLKASSGLIHGFVYAAGKMADLNDLILQESGWVITEARAINDAGYIAANALSSTGQSRAVLLVPDDHSPQVALAEFQYQRTPRTLTFRFDEDVSTTLGPDDLLVTNLNTNELVGGLDYSYNAQTNIASFAFSANLVDGNYRVSINSGGIEDRAGWHLDGDGDGAAGGDFQFEFFLLRGDANQDRSVDFADLVALAQNYNSSGKDWSQGDFDGDGGVGFSDLVALAQNYNTTLPPPAGLPVMATADELRAGIVARSSDANYLKSDLGEITEVGLGNPTLNGNPYPKNRRPLAPSRVASPVPARRTPPTRRARDLFN